MEKARVTPAPSDRIPLWNCDLDFWEAVAAWPRLPLGTTLHRWFTASLSISGERMGGARSLREQARLFWCAQICGRAEAFLDSLAEDPGSQGEAASTALVVRLSRGAGRPGNFPSFVCQRAALLDQLVLAELFPMLALLNPARHDPYWTSEPPCRLKELRERHVLPLLRATQELRGVGGAGGRHSWPHEALQERLPSSPRQSR